MAGPKGGRMTERCFIGIDVWLDTRRRPPLVLTRAAGPGPPSSPWKPPATKPWQPPSWGKPACPCRGDPAALPGPWPRPTAWRPRRANTPQPPTAEGDRDLAALTAVVRVQRRHMARPRIERMVAVLNAELATWTGRSLWQQREQLLRTVPGVGPILSLTLLADLPELVGQEGHRRVGGPGAPRPRQRPTPRPAVLLGRARPRTHRPLYAHRRGPARQSGHPGLLRPAGGPGQTQEGGSRLHAQAPHHPQRHRPPPDPLLPSITVAEGTPELEGGPPTLTRAPRANADAPLPSPHGTAHRHHYRAMAPRARRVPNDDPLRISP